jgi:SpoVK/Ycf46/Vps4 family AAA+-type ATPase
MRQETFRPVLERLLATRRARIDESQIGARRRGMRVLFTGHSGRNRLRAAQLFAHELSVDLYEIDLDRLVRQDNGDTEKNLNALFDAAEATNAVLMFDDTDHLFANAVAEESGRFPSLNVGRLRQRLEAYDGVVLLGADHRAHVDPQFTTQCDEVVELADD